MEQILMRQIGMGQNHYLSRHMSLVDLNPHHWASIPCKLLMIWPLFFKADAVRKKIFIDTYLYSGHLNWAGKWGSERTLLMCCLVQELQKLFQVLIGQLRMLFGLKSDNNFQLADGITCFLTGERGFSEW